MKSNERRNAIVRILCKRKYEKLGNLAFEFGVSERTIRRDIQEIALSYPIYTISDKKFGGVYIDVNYHLERSYLSIKQEMFLRKIIEQYDAEDKQIIISIIDNFSKREK